MVQEYLELSLSPEDYTLLTDLYQLTMIACYVGEKIDQRQASFELFVRKLPTGFGYLIAMGLAQALDYLEKFRFSSEQIDALKSTGIFANAPSEFWSLLAEAKFTGNVWAVKEGTAIFPNQPLLRIEAPLWQGQLVETYLLNTMNYQTLIATKAARMRDIAGNSTKLLEFGTRRAFSPQASVLAARAALAGGMDATSNVLAALKLGRKPVGTMAHSLVMAISAVEGSEEDAFKSFQRYFPTATLLIDTYDTLSATRLLARRVKQGEMQISGVRLDSGNLVELSQKVRSLLPEVRIFASGDIDEWEIARLVKENACIDGYGIGTKLVTGVPVNGVYKLVEIDGIPAMKNTTGKVSYPGRKQIYRYLENGQLKQDYLGLMAEDVLSQTEPHTDSFVKLMIQVVKNGERLQTSENLEAIAKRTAISVASLPPETRSLENPILPPMKISHKLQQLTQKTQANSS
ncbi:MAG: nicotinate phosphoribosyltransferase [Trichodesmium sp. St16_bin4-tuft]|nr:nicotinate phosphoribosyltransferase [Trichodesmium sp. St4_bin8_1]MDE5072591.1 nicotinate phosphoribosyltransferase [Trichodesmium sp. St5_bin8]MDE5077925.1 nicotinate phosphoribosyltransferase [Trichodesmium sp. St2_bin6]MDE5090295.1 nicotinate phosphoribosyltransferase [Trichodesmium sp. St18_bin3_1_1]MDE5101384.1 nicotinate phosphoribosyltransferase [Trichodesmium sp. St16_bin4-tuft]MDE5102159.1 nicotinate phosphoribosyltransferase [Trichodesmium sp. St19_bin2]